MSGPVSPGSAAFRARVSALVARIPPGRVMTYGQLATLAGAPGAARQAGFVLNSLAQTDLPWQRVINAQGMISTDRLGFGDLQRGLLLQEGVLFDAAGRCDLKRLQWWPDEEGAPGQAGLF